MPINPALLIAAPMLQDYIVDKSTGGPLVGGVITLYQDNSRTTLKNWYYQSGSPGNYTYITLPNPMTLSGVGTITDPNGNDTIPFFYPYDENSVTPVLQPYFITVYSADGQFQFDRQNFPFIPGTNPTPIETAASFNNLVVNNVFWRNIATIPDSEDLTNVTNLTIAPGNHDGFSMPDIQWFKSIGGEADTLQFKKFLAGQFLSPPTNQDVTPEYYLNVSCTSVGGSAAYKYVQFPISLHLKTLEDVEMTFSVWARSNGGGNNVISIKMLQFAGTVISTPGPGTTETSFNLTSTFTKYTFSFTTANAPNIVSQVQDDAWYLQIAYPIGMSFNIDIAKPSLYIGTTIPDNEFITYDEVDTIINSPRTGDFRISMNSFQPYGWIALNDGTIGNTGAPSIGFANTRHNVDTWQLYNLIYNSVDDFWAPVQGGRGASAYNDFIANKPMRLPRTLGRVLAGQNGYFPPTFNATQQDEPNSRFLIPDIHTTNPQFYSNGTPLFLTTNNTLPAPLQPYTVYYAIFDSATQMAVALSPDNAEADIRIIWTAPGVGAFTIHSALGANFGEGYHTITDTEIPSHRHYTDGGFNFVNTDSAHGGGAVYQAGPDGGQENVTGPPTDVTNSPIQIFQPTLETNFFLKL